MLGIFQKIQIFQSSLPRLLLGLPIHQKGILSPLWCGRDNHRRDANG